MDILNTLNQFLLYSAETGVLTWKQKPNRRIRLGDKAGTVDHNGYTVVRIQKITYCAHRIAWLFTYGQWPVDQLDHINGKRSDNRICNLREVNNTENAHNQRVPQKRNIAGFLGVSRNGKNWRATIRVHGISYHIGTFATQEEAGNAYIAKKREVHKTCTI